jgi:hypothetical protein
MRYVIAIAVASCGLLALSACSEDNDVTSQEFLSSAPRMPLSRTRPWVEDFKLGIPPAAGGAIQVKEEFAPGEAICLSMAVNEAPRGAVATVYWYGPNHQNLDYEGKELATDKERLRFVQADTKDWPAGSYRAEVWIGNYKLGERRFRIATE